MMENPIKYCRILFFLLVVVCCSNVLFAQGEAEQLVVMLGQSRMIDFSNPIKRVSIPTTDIADASVITPLQLLLTGKAAGITSLVVWDERENYHVYKVVVREELALCQINLKVRFAEINENGLRELGVDFWYKNLQMGERTGNFGVFGGKVGAPNDPLLLSDVVDIFFSIPDLNVSMILKALEEKNLLTVLAKPNISAINGAEASFLAGGEFPIPIVSGAAGMQTVTIQFKEFGIKLKFTPKAMDANTVNIKVAAEVSSLDFENGVIISGFRIPALTTRKAETTVELPTGKYLIIGGLLSSEMAKTISRIPLLGHIPILGKLFSSTRFQKKESELLVLLTPEIIKPLNENEVPELRKLKF